MTISYIQYSNEYETTTYIIDDISGKFYQYRHHMDGAQNILSIDNDPRVAYTIDIDNIDDELESLIHTDDINMLSGEEDELDVIRQFVESGCVVGTYASKIDHTTQPKSYSPDVLLYWEHYQKLNGKLINAIDEYDYYFNLFYMLTQNKVGGDCPIPSVIGFDQFGKIINEMCKHSSKKMKSNIEYTIFFRSIDEIHSYS